MLERGLKATEDAAAEIVNGESKPAGAGGKYPDKLLLAAHMDTVEPGEGIRAVVKMASFTRQGDTILGATIKPPLRPQ